MAIHNLDSIFRPKRIAIIGVPTNPNSVGGITLKNLVGGGFRGVVYPVNPKHEAVMGIPCFPDVKSLPKTPDLAVICTAADVVPSLIEECGDAGIKGIIIMSAGFKESGEKGKKLEEKVKENVDKYPGMRVLGPNCLGVVIPGQNLNVSFSNSIPKKGHVAFISQSGALGTSVLDWASEEKIGFSFFVSIGNSMDVSFGDLIDYFGADVNTKSIVLYVESITKAREFMTAARAFARKKPIIVYKAGRYPESAAVAESHTGAMAIEDQVYDAVFKRAGIARVNEFGNIFDFTDLISRKRIPKGTNLAIITNAGGPGVMATDTLISRGGHLCKLSDETIQKLNECLPDYWSHGNPVDILGDATPERFTCSTSIVLKDANVDAVLIICTPQAMTEPTQIAREICTLSENSTKPIMAAWLGGTSMKEGIRIFNEAGIAAFETPEQAIHAFMTLASYSANLNALFETPKDIPLTFTYDRKRLREEFNNTLIIKDKILNERLSKRLLGVYSIPTTEPIFAATEDEAVRLADKIGYPVVMKIESPDIPHKSDVGGVQLNIRNEQGVRKTYKSIMYHVSEKEPDARIDGVTIQQMVQVNGGVELILGIKKDKVFGTVILAGMGGIGAELFQDKVLGFPPLNEKLARQMLESLKIYPLLTGYRGSNPKNIDKLIELMIRLSYLAADYPEIEELDINPVIVGDDEVVAVDARVVLDQELMGKTVTPYSHLIIRPYPEKLVRTGRLSDGTQVVMRPIKPEDEPMWLELLGSCSKEAIYSRFRQNFHFDSHEIATQFCYIDYAREMAIVAEIMEEGRRKLIGVGRLIGDPDMKSAEYAVLITDAWQKKDLGNMLTSFCSEIAERNKVTKLWAETTNDNKGMIAVFKKQGFSVDYDGGSVYVEKKLN